MNHSGVLSSHEPEPEESAGHSLQSCIARFCQLFCSALGEIFDESAYARFLSRRQLAPSRQSYTAFLHEQEHIQARRPRCC